MSTNSQLLSILAPRKGPLFLIILTIIAGAGLELVPPIVMRQVIDHHLTPQLPAGLWLLAIAYLASVAGLQGLGFLTAYLTALTAQGALHDLRVKLYSHFQKLPLSYFDQNPLGDTISRCTADVDTIDTLFSSGVSGLVTDLVRLFAITFMMFCLSPKLTLISALVVPPLWWISHLFRIRIRDAERKSRKAISMVNTHLQETLGGVEVIRAFGREAVFVTRFRQALKQTLLAFRQATACSSCYSPLMQCLMAAAIGLLLWNGVWNGAHREHVALPISLGTLTAFVLLFKRFFDPITSLGEEWQTVQSALSGAERIFEILAIPQDEPASHTPQPTHPHACRIDVRQLTFGYRPDPTQPPVLQDISFTVAPGEHVAMVGRTGAGKTSILSLLGGLYTPWQGIVRLAGHDPRLLDDTARRHVIGVVPQQVQLFSGTILENLTLGDTSVTREAVERAAGIAGIDTFIRALPDGYDTRISSGRGQSVQFSSGQRQLLSLARALVWDPSVLLLDEATSAIDSASEAAFRQALMQETQTRQPAILTVAHRLSTAREADRVIVLEAGRIVEMDTPQNLITNNGRFAALLELEAAGWNWQAG